MGKGGAKARLDDVHGKRSKQLVMSHLREGVFDADLGLRISTALGYVASALNHIQDDCLALSVFCEASTMHDFLQLPVVELRRMYHEGVVACDAVPSLQEFHLGDLAGVAGAGAA